MEIIVVNHGSRRGDFNKLMEEWAAELSRRLGVKAVVGYNEYAEPNWRDLLKRAEGPVIIALAFLGAGNHVVRDILGELGVEMGKWQMSKFGKLVYVTEPLGNSPLVFNALLSRVKRALGNGVESGYISDAEEIEMSSMGYVAAALGLDLNNWKHSIIARAVYASGNLELAKFVYISDDLLGAAREALIAEAPCVVDVKMVAAGMRYPHVYIAVEAPVNNGGTRASAGMSYWLSRLNGACVVIGNAPTALKAALDMWSEGKADIPFAVAAPVGFTNASHVKEELVKSRLPAVVIRGTYGGSGIAVALFNELLRLAYEG